MIIIVNTAKLLSIIVNYCCKSTKGFHVIVKARELMLKKKQLPYIILINPFMENYLAFRTPLFDLHCQSVIWFLYDGYIGLKLVKFLNDLN